MSDKAKRERYQRVLAENEQLKNKVADFLRMQEDYLHLVYDGVKMREQIATHNKIIDVLKHDNFYLRQDKQTAQNAAESYGRQLEQAESRIKVLTDALGGVLVDLEHAKRHGTLRAFGMVYDIQRALSGKESGK